MYPLVCYNSCPNCPGNTTGSTNLTCANGDTCSVSVSYRNGTLLGAHRGCIPNTKASCLNKCLDPDPTLQIDCTFCCNTELCNTGTPAPQTTAPPKNSAVMGVAPFAILFFAAIVSALNAVFWNGLFNKDYHGYVICCLFRQTNELVGKMEFWGMKFSQRVPLFSSYAGHHVFLQSLL